jgi:hypothetical protein
MNLMLILGLYIVSNIVQNQQSSILQAILSVGNYPPLSMLYFQQQSLDMGTKSYNMSVTNSWTFTLTDAFGNQVDLNGVPWSFSLLLYQRNNTHEIHKQDLLINNETRLFNAAETQQQLINQVNQNQQPLGSSTAGAPADIPIYEPIVGQHPWGSSTAMKDASLPGIVYPDDSASTAPEDGSIPQIVYPRR